MSLLTAIFGDANKRYLENLRQEVDFINSKEADISALTDQQLRAKTTEFRQRLSTGTTLDEILPEVFAVVREAAKRTLNQRHFDVQLMGGLVMHKGQVAEMKTGEGKTLTSTLAIYANALSGKGVHLITVNDYLARRDATWMGQIYDFLGLTVGVIVHDASFIYDPTHSTAQEDEIRDQGVVVEQDFLRPVTRRQAYEADITYGTNNEFGFDYLRDNLAQRIEDQVQKPLHYAIVDEVDSILIDEARTPLIISAPDMESTDQYVRFANIVKTLDSKSDYTIDEKMRAVSLSDQGIGKIEKILGVDNIYETSGIQTVHHIEQALKALTLFHRDKDYVVRDGEILIVDEFTGRLMQGRRYSEGLHQAIEAKEGVAVQRENRTMATITFQNYFRMYEKLAGMTGTAATEAEELAKIYNLEVTTIPTNKPLRRQDLPDKIYRSEKGKWQAIIQEIKERNAKGQPILIGTISIEKNEILSALLDREGLKFQMLNAKQHEKEGEIIAQAGAKGAITVATNMAGRGVDIKLGGTPFDEKKYQEIVELGGLAVIGTERHESRRIDNQLRGRAGRQGDPGSSQFYISLDDDLLRIFGSERMKSVMTRLGLPEDVAIENKIISRSIEGAQKKVEGHNFDIRKHLVEYDDIINKQRQIIYQKRQKLLSETNGQQALDYIDQLLLTEVTTEIDTLLDMYLPTIREQWNLTELIKNLSGIMPISAQEESLLQSLTQEKEPAETIRNNIRDNLTQLLQQKYQQLKDYIAHELSVDQNARHPFIDIAKSIVLRSIDMLWVEHLDSIQQLRAGIGLQGYGQRDPLVEYKREAFGHFNRLLAAIRSQICHTLFHIGVNKQSPAQTEQRLQLREQKNEVTSFSGQEKQKSESKPIESKPKDAEGQKIGRNDPCWCGSGKKYKKCHGA